MKYSTITAPAVIKNMTTAKLIEVFILTGSVNNENIPTVRGWIMDELEFRNPEAFNAWVESDDFEDEAILKYFN